MGTKKQPKDSSWYNNRCVMSLLFIVVFICVLIFLPIWVKNNITNTDIGVFGWFYLGAVLIGLLILCFVYFWGIKKSIRGAIKEVACLNIKKDIFKDTIKGVAKSRINEDCIKKAVKEVVLSEGIKNTLASAIAQAPPNAAQNTSITKAEVIDGIKGVIEAKTTDFLKNGDVKDIIKSELKDKMTPDLLKDAVKDAVSGMKDIIKKARLDEYEEKRYRLAERVVALICNGDKNKQTDINAINDLIASIMGNEHKYCHVEMIETAGTTSLVFVDVNGKQVKLEFDSTNNSFTSPDNGSHTLRNGYIITINNGKIESIKKS